MRRLPLRMSGWAVRLKKDSIVAHRSFAWIAFVAVSLTAVPAVAQECAREVEEISDRLGIEVVSPEFFTDLDGIPNINIDQSRIDIDRSRISDTQLFDELQTPEAQMARRLTGQIDATGGGPRETLWVHDYDAPDVLLARSRLVGARTFSLLGREDFCRRGLQEAKEILGPLLDQ